MKRILLLVTLAIGMMACSTDDAPTTPPINQIATCNCYKVLEYNDYTYNWNTGQGSSTGWYFVLNVANAWWLHDVAKSKRKHSIKQGTNQVQKQH
jgi:hypothetical protein